MRLLYLFLLLGTCAHAQPYLDVASIRYARGFDDGLVRRGFTPNRFHYANVQVQVPVLFKKDSSMLLFNPIVEQWRLRLNTPYAIPDRLDGTTLFTAFVKPWSRKLSTTIAIIPRWNGSGVSGQERLQLGGLFLATINRKPGLKYRAGVYFNREFFGNFIVPILGIEYRVKPGLNLFGNLPGSLTLEKKVTQRFYCGASFRAVTNSYRYRSSAGDALRFIRIDENQLQTFADLYLSPRMVLTTEIGHSFFRRIRMGQEGGNSKYMATEKFNDGVVARVALAYRMRFY